MQGILDFDFDRARWTIRAAFSFAQETKKISLPGLMIAALPTVVPKECVIPEERRSAPAPAAVLFSLKIWWGKTFM